MSRGGGGICPWGKCPGRNMSGGVLSSHLLGLSLGFRHIIHQMKVYSFPYHLL